MSVNAINGQENRTRKTVIASLAGAGVGAIGGALTYSPFKGEELKDSFVKQVAIRSADCDKERVKGLFKLVKQGAKLADENGNFTAENAKKFIKSFYKVETNSIVKKACENELKGSDDEIIKSAKEMLKVYQGVVTGIKEGIKPAFDGKKLKSIPENATEEFKEFIKDVKSTMTAGKVKTAAIGAAVVGAAVGAGAYLLNKVNAAKNNEKTN